MKKKRNFPIFFIVLLICSLTACENSETSVQTHGELQEESIQTEGNETKELSNITPEALKISDEVETLIIENLEIETDETIEATNLSETAELSLIMVGDILLHTRVEECAIQEDGTYNYNAIFEPVKTEIKNADLAIVNQEVIIGGEELGVSGYPCFNAPYEMGDALVDAGFDVVCHATNHALDKGKKGLLNCAQFWKEDYPDIAVLGINETAQEQEEIYVHEQDGIRIAILNYTYGTNGIALPQDMPFAVNMLEEAKVISDIQKAEEIADFTVVCPHWGTEYVLKQTKEQERWAKLFLENGVDLVLGTHPHVIEPIEMLVDEETGNEMLVYYSIGNFVNWTSESGTGKADRMVGGMAEVTIGLNENGEAVIEDYGVTALVTHLAYGTNGVYTMKLADYTQELSLASEMIHQDAAFSKEYCVNLCNEVWADLWH